MARSVLKILLSNVGGFVAFLVLLGIANILLPHIKSLVYVDIVLFLNRNLILFTILMLVGLINDILWNYNFPFNLLAPISGSVLSIFVVIFILRVWSFLNNYVQSSWLPPEKIYIPIALFVLMAGYALILAKMVRKGVVSKPVSKKKPRKRK